MLPDQTPELKLLQIQFDILRKEFSELLERKNEMLTYDEPFLTALYLNAIGQRLHQKYCLGVEIKILYRRIQLMQAYINQNVYPDKKLIEQKLEKQFSEFQQKIVAEAERLAMAKKFMTDTTFLPPHIVKKIKEVYITIVKRLHPDINPEITEKEKDLLLQAQAAYELSNLDALNAILVSLDFNTPAPATDPAGLKERVEKLKEQTEKLKKLITELNAKFPFSYRDKLAEEEWIKAEQQSLDNDIASLSTEKNKYSEYLLLMDDWKPQGLK